MISTFSFEILLTQDCPYFMFSAEVSHVFKTWKPINLELVLSPTGGNSIFAALS